MQRFVLVSFVILLAVGSATASAATLNGSFTYDGQPVSAVFPGYAHGAVGAYDSASSEWTYGTVDVVTGTYQISGLDQGSYFVRLLIGPEDFENRVFFDELTDFGYVDVGAEAQVAMDFALRYAYRIIEPFGAYWPGSITDCPRGPAAATTFTFAWEPVPRAVSYQVRIRRYSCDGAVGTDVIDTTETTASVVQGTASGEEYLGLQVIALANDGADLAQRPWLDYDNGSSEGAYLHGGGGGSTRTPHPSSSVFLPQVARLPGVAPSFWTSDLVLTNPTAFAVNATLTYTERDANGLDDYQQESVTVPAKGCRVVEDVVGELFHSTGAGWLEVSPSSLLVSSRIATPGSAGGSYGQGFPALSADAAVSLAGPVKTLRTGGVARGDFRSNLVLTEVWGESVTVKVTILDSDGVGLGSTNVSLAPFATTQLNDVVHRVGGPATLEEGQVTVEVTSGAGRVVSVLSLVDQGTGDPTTLVLEPLS